MSGHLSWDDTMPQTFAEFSVTAFSWFGGCHQLLFSDEIITGDTLTTESPFLFPTVCALTFLVSHFSLSYHNSTLD